VPTLHPYGGRTSRSAAPSCSAAFCGSR
jgi:hypothetical protein